MNEFSLALAGLQTAGRIAKAFIDLKLDSAVTEKAIELQGTIISLQQQLLAIQEQMQSLSESKGEVERRLVEYEKWDIAESQYDLMELRFGGCVRTPNASHPTPHAKHWLCANCFEKKKKSFLQPVRNKGLSWYYCPECSVEYRLHQDEQYPPLDAPTP